MAKYRILLARRPGIGRWRLALPRLAALRPGVIKSTFWTAQNPHGQAGLLALRVLDFALVLIVLRRLPKDQQD